MRLPGLCTLRFGGCDTAAGSKWLVRILAKYIIERDAHGREVAQKCTGSLSSRLKEVDYRLFVYLIALRFCPFFLPSLIFAIASDPHIASFKRYHLLSIDYHHSEVKHLPFPDHRMNILLSHNVDSLQSEKSLYPPPHPARLRYWHPHPGILRRHSPWLVVKHPRRYRSRRLVFCFDVFPGSY